MRARYIGGVRGVVVPTAGTVAVAVRLAVVMAVAGGLAVTVKVG